MSQWIERVRDHQIFANLAEIRAVVEDAKECSAEEPAFIDYWDRANTIVVHLKSRLEQADPLLITVATLNNLASVIQQAVSELRGFISTKNPQHWLNSLSNLENALSYAAAIPQQSATGIDNMKEVAANYRTAVSGWMAAIKKENGNLSNVQAALQTKITEAVTEINAQKQRLDTAIATFQQQFSEAQQARQTEFSVSEQERVKTAAQGEKNRQDDFESAENERSESADKAAQERDKQHAELIAKLRSDSKAILEAMEEFKAHAQKLVGIISETGMAHGYQKTANSERKSAKSWGVVAASALGIWIVIGVVFFCLTYDKELTWTAVARQFMISTPFVLLAGFAAMQVSIHQKNERRLRRAELEIASLDPFLATLDDEERNVVKKEFATRYFGQREEESKHESSEPKFLELLGGMLKLVQDAQGVVRK